MTINGYNIDLILNHAEAEEFDYSQLSFSLQDSIYDLYSKGSISVFDSSGLLLESRGFTDGVPLEITYGLGEEYINNFFLIHGMEVLEDRSGLALGGRVSAKLLQNAARESTARTNVYTTRISDIVGELFNSPFENIFIETTRDSLRGMNVYRAHMSQEEFIHRVLLPNALSTESPSSPFFCFIDSTNQFHFESYHKMSSRSPSKILILNGTKTIDHYTQRILDFMPFSFDVQRHKKNLSYNIEGFTDEEDPVYEEEPFSALDFGNKPFPIFDLTPEVQVVDNNFNYRSIERVQAELLYNQRELVGADKVLVTTPLNPSLHSGLTVELDVEYEDESVSHAYSGIYLIERSDHVWEGTEQRGYTQLVLGTKSPSFPLSSTLERGLWQ